MYYPDEVVEEVRNKNDIVEVISGYVKIQKKGSNYFGLCPFHNEKSPSFSVSANKQMYYCFGCGAGGNVFTFLMEYENYSFQEAIQSLAQRAGVKLPEGEYNEQDRARDNKKARLLKVNKEAARYFYYQLRAKAGAAGYQYLRRRELSDETIHKFGLGFANVTSDDLTRYLRSKGYEDKLIQEAGLAAFDEKYGMHDKFWNRVMFPIQDSNNRVIGFGGRVMGDGKPKYLNSPETMIFDKSRNLYGLNFARSSRAGNFILCEGYMDVIAMQQAGFTNAVASLGTAFTERHAILLKRYTDQVILTFDSDGAGVKAALRAIPMLREAGLSARVLDMRPCKDPDEFMKTLGPEEFKKRAEHARNSFLFEIDVLKSGYDMGDPEQKTEFYNRAAEKLLEFSEALERDNYIQAVSREYMIPYDDLRALVNRLGLRGGPAASSRPQRLSQEEAREARPAPAAKRREKEEGIRSSERLLLTWLIEEPRLFDVIHGIIGPEDFVKPLYRAAAEAVFEAREAGEVKPAAILNRFIDDEGSYKEVAALFNASLDESLTNEEQKKAFSETVRRVKKNSLEHQIRRAKGIDELQRLIKEQAGLANLHISPERG